MAEELSFEFRLTKIYETRYYFLEEIKHNGLMSKKYKNTWSIMSKTFLF